MESMEKPPPVLEITTCLWALSQVDQDSGRSGQPGDLPLVHGEIDHGGVLSEQEIDRTALHPCRLPTGNVVDLLRKSGD